MRGLELALILSPLALITAWYLGARMLSRRMLVLVALGLITLGALLFQMGDSRRISGTYVPARLDGETITQAHGTTAHGTHDHP